MKNNTARKDDSDKPRMELIPPFILVALAKVLTFGAKKYGANNWQKLENFKERYTGALMRHLESWRSGEEIDPESGQPHLAHIFTNVAFLLWDYLRRRGK